MGRLISPRHTCTPSCNPLFFLIVKIMHALLPVDGYICNIGLAFLSSLLAVNPSIGDNLATLGSPIFRCPARSFCW
jgi:hypothetical protein